MTWLLSRSSAVLTSFMQSSTMALKEIPANFSPEERGERARALFNEGYNCSQSVILAFEDMLNIPHDELVALATGFGGGIGHMREVCGTVSGMTFIAGQMSPAERNEKQEKMHCYEIVQKMAAEFRQVNRSIICRELLGLVPIKDESPEPEERTPEYYRKRPCGELCAIAATIVARNMIENRQ